MTGCTSVWTHLGIKVYPFCNFSPYAMANVSHSPLEPQHWGMWCPFSIWFYITFYISVCMYVCDCLRPSCYMYACIHLHNNVILFCVIPTQLSHILSSIYIYFIFTSCSSLGMCVCVCLFVVLFIEVPAKFA